MKKIAMILFAALALAMGSCGKADPNALYEKLEKGGPEVLETFKASDFDAMIDYIDNVDFKNINSDNKIMAFIGALQGAHMQGLLTPEQVKAMDKVSEKMESEAEAFLESFTPDYDDEEVTVVEEVVEDWDE